MDETWFSLKRIRLWLGGGLLLYILLSVALFAGPFSRDAERRANDILLLNGFGWAEADAYGRGMAIRGVAPSEEAGEAAVRAVGKDWAVSRAWGAYTVKPPGTSLAPSPGWDVQVVAARRGE